MPLYEHVFMTRQDVSATQVESLTDSFKAIVEEGGGKITKSEYWGLKSLTYRVKKNRKAHFSLMNIDSPHEAVAEMERQQAISDDVIRILTLKVDEHEEGPSIMMQKPSRDDKRGPRRDGPRKPAFGAGDSKDKTKSADTPAKTDKSEDKTDKSEDKTKSADAPTKAAEPKEKTEAVKKPEAADKAETEEASS